MRWNDRNMINISISWLWFSVFHLFPMFILIKKQQGALISCVDLLRIRRVKASWNRSWRRSSSLDCILKKYGVDFWYYSAGKGGKLLPISCMYGILYLPTFTIKTNYIISVGKCTIHGSYRLWVAPFENNVNVLNRAGSTSQIRGWLILDDQRSEVSLLVIASLLTYCNLVPSANLKIHPSE